MELHVVPLTKTQFNEKIIIKIANEGCDLKLSCDSEKPDLRQLNFLSCLFEGDCDGRVVSNKLLGHLHYSFLILCPTDILVELLSKGTRIDVHRISNNPNVVVFMMSGTLDQFKECIITQCTNSDLREIREIYNKILAHFDSLGLGHIFSEYRRKQHKDKTLLLELKE